MPSHDSIRNIINTPFCVYVNANVRLDPESDNLPVSRTIEIWSHPSPASVYRVSLFTRAVNVPDPDSVQGSHAGGNNMLEILGSTINIKAICRHSYLDDPVLRHVVSNPSNRDNFQTHDGVVQMLNHFRMWVACIPSQAVHDGCHLVELLLDQAHSLLGHLGRAKTQAYLANFVWWPSMSSKIDKYCTSCVVCQQIKPPNYRPYSLLKSLPIPSRRWSSVGIDFVGPLTESGGFNFLMVVIDRLTSMVHIIPTTSTARASDVAWDFLNNVVKLHGFPESIVSDRDTRFTSRFWRQLQKACGTKLLMSTTFHPQTDGAMEHANSTIGQILCSLIRSDQKDWIRKIPLVKIAINNGVNESSKFSPYALNYGFTPRFTNFNDLADSGVAEGVRNFVDQARCNLLEAHDNIIAQCLCSETLPNRTRSLHTIFPVG
jgi:hypothetical protein